MTERRIILDITGVAIPVIVSGGQANVDSMVVALQPLSWALNSLRSGGGAYPSRVAAQRALRATLEAGEDHPEPIHQGVVLAHVRTAVDAEGREEDLTAQRAFWRALSTRDAGDDAYILGVIHERDREALAPRAFLLALIDQLDEIERQS